MPKALPIPKFGERFGILTVVVPYVESLNPKKPKRCSLVVCDCDQKMIAVPIAWLRNRNNSSCGCVQREKALRNFSRHWGDGAGCGGGKHPRTHASWAAMRRRCNNPKADAFRFYGAKGITVCERWQNSFEAFLADMGERPEGKTLDRVDPYGNYEPGNCRWATRAEQMSNRR